MDKRTFDKVNQLHDLATMCRSENHAHAATVASKIDAIAEHVKCGNTVMADSMTKALVHAFDVCNILRGLDKTYAELTAKIVWG